MKMNNHWGSNTLKDFITIFINAVVLIGLTYIYIYSIDINLVFMTVISSIPLYLPTEGPPIINNPINNYISYNDGNNEENDDKLPSFPEFLQNLPKKDFPSVELNPIKAEGRKGFPYFLLNPTDEFDRGDHWNKWSPFKAGLKINSWYLNRPVPVLDSSREMHTPWYNHPEYKAIDKNNEEFWNKELEKEREKSREIQGAKELNKLYGAKKK
jgi:hypothetical protein